MFAPTAGMYPRPMFRLGAALRLFAVLALALALVLTALGPSRSLSGAAAPTHPAATLADLPADAQAAIAASLGREDAAYHATAQAGGFQFANARHGLRASFDAAGLTLTGGGGSGTMALRGYGYGEAMQAPQAATPRADANRVSYARGTLTEWYLNSPLGLEQGFTLAQAPTGTRAGPLTLALALDGWNAALDGSNDSALLTAAGGAALRYSGLVAYDAAGRTLPAWLETHGAGLRLRVDDAGARYPLTIDPAMIDPFVEQAQLTASDGIPGDALGVSIAMDGDTIVVGAPIATLGGNFAQGAAYVYVKPAGGWATTSGFAAKLTASDGLPLDIFGWSVAISGDTIVVGTPRFAFFSSPTGPGAAYVYVKPAGGWASATETAILTSSSGTPLDLLGWSVGISGDTIIAGAPGYFTDSPSGGAAYVYVKPGGGWATGTETAVLTPSDSAPGDFFGASVAISGDVIAAGAPHALFFGGSTGDLGAAYVYVKPGGGWATTAAETAKLTPSDSAPADAFGFSVAIDGDTLVAGATGAGGGAGAAYVYDKPGGGWATTAAETAILTASDGAAGDSLGWSAAISGDMIAVGAIGAGGGAGAAYVYDKPGGGWASTTESAKQIASDGASGDAYGWSVTASGGDGAAGAPFCNSTQGAAYVFGSSPSSGSPSSGCASDTTAPTITITTPPDGATYTLGQVVNADYSCADEVDGSGLASCVGTVPNGSAIDTSSVGAKSFTVNAADNAGNTSTLTHNYSVVYAFSGFFAPVDNAPTFNQVNAGQSIPVKFSLGGNQGLNIFAAGYPASQQINCSSSAPIDVIEETTTANSGLTYDAATGRYTYVWKTQKSWAGTCRQFTLGLADGSTHIALFKFK